MWQRWSLRIMKVLRTLCSVIEGSSKRQSYRIKCNLFLSLNSPGYLSKDIALGKIWQVTHLDASTHSLAPHFPEGLSDRKTLLTVTWFTLSLFSRHKSHCHTHIHTAVEKVGEIVWSNGVEYEHMCVCVCVHFSLYLSRAWGRTCWMKFNVCMSLYDFVWVYMSSPKLKHSGTIHPHLTWTLFTLMSFQIWLSYNENEWAEK